MALKPRPLQPRTRQIIGAALLALLLGQWAALWHAVAHAAVPPPVWSQDQATGAATAVHQDHRSELAAAFTDDQTGHLDNSGPNGHSGDSGHTAGSPVCQLFDHLLLGQAPADACAPKAPLPTGAELLPLPPAAVTSSTAVAAYEARGPPRA